MSGRSAMTAGRIWSEDMAGRLFLPAAKEKPRPQGRGSDWSANAPGSVALTEQLQQQREQVDEVQIERQRAGDCRTLRDLTTLRGIAVNVVVLQPLGIPGGEAREYQHADHRDDELQHRAGQEEIEQARDDDAEQAHDKERAHAGQVTLG